MGYVPIQQTPAPSPVTETLEVHPVIPWLTAPRRRWLYGVVTAAQPLAVALSLATENVAPLVAGVILAFIGTGTAGAHTPR